ncbi:MAG: hypothetical protein UT48_C0035G0009 [Parcubacteria group bacterium GW2011_GWE2_39_37]|nr:MAG: hypothetical protein UT48_C0035G0009 [Parcubacteria group bacterium GW2011_GWE2_39_37]
MQNNRLAAVVLSLLRVILSMLCDYRETLIPGPMVEVMETFLIYTPLDLFGLTFLIKSTTAVKFSINF